MDLLLDALPFLSLLALAILLLSHRMIGYYRREAQYFADQALLCRWAIEQLDQHPEDGEALTRLLYRSAEASQARFMIQEATPLWRKVRDGGKPDKIKEIS